jgi:putative transposase
MRKSRFMESQIVGILAEGDAGLPVAEICRKHGISKALYYQWKSRYSGVSVNELKRVRELESENSRLKKMDAELALENTAIRDVLSRKLQRRSQSRLLWR